MLMFALFGLGVQDLRFRLQKLRLQKLWVVASLVTGFAAHGQAGSLSDESNVLEEVLVVATKRTTLVQDVAIAVSAYSGDDLNQRGVFEVAQVAAVSPSLTINTLGNNTQTIVRIRGVGTDGVNVGFESAVGMFVDGVFRPRAGQALSDLLDVERVEVMRGPQGTLFGKNTSAGAVNIISKRPEFEFGGELSGSAGDFDLRRFSAVVTGPLVEESLAFRLAVGSHTRNGILDKLGPGANPATRSDEFYNDRDRIAFKGQLLYEPSDDLSTRLIVDYRELDEMGNISMPLLTGPVSQLGFAGGTFGVPPGTPFSSSGLNALGAFVQPDRSLDDRQVQNNSDPFEKITDYGITAEIEWSLGPGQVTSLSAVRDFESSRANDLDLVGADILGPLPESTEIKLFTQEFRFSGSTDKVDWLAGLYYFDETIDFTSQVSIGAQFAEFFGNGLPPGAFTGEGARQRGEQTNSGFALFTHNIFHVSDNWHLTGGLRYSRSDKDATSFINEALPGQPSINDSVCGPLSFITTVCDNRSFSAGRAENAVSGTLSARYEFNSDTSTYFSYTRGYKAGGINLDRESVSDAAGVVMDQSQFDPEFVNSYEVGLKTSLQGGRANLNLTAFYSDFEDFQLNSFNGIMFSVISIRQAVSQGLELDYRTLLGDDLEFNMAASYIDARFADELNDPELVLYEGRRLPESSLWQASAALNGMSSLPNTDWQLIYAADISYRSDAISGSLPLPEQRQGGYALLGASIGLERGDGRLGIVLAGTNLADKTVAPFISPTIFQPGSYSAYLNAPRMLSLTLNYAF
ncbi:MAG: TonB-dependent receptor [Gammaproteobacteria bacterium]